MCGEWVRVYSLMCYEGHRPILLTSARRQIGDEHITKVDFGLRVFGTQSLLVSCINTMKHLSLILVNGGGGGSYGQDLNSTEQV